MDTFYENGKLPKEGHFRLNELDRDNYFVKPELKDVIDLALLMQKPLLLTGRPGTGKTDLAKHLALRFTEDDVIRFHTRTTSVLKDVLYHYDAIAHYHASRHEVKPLSVEEINKRFIRLVGLGKAIEEAKKGIPRVVLIDEIDKAPRDFPNDLLDTLDNMRFDIPELRSAKEDAPDISVIEAQSAIKPIVIMTSNSEKNLPEPFLRRCLFYNIPDHTEEELEKIALQRLPELEKLKDPIQDYLEQFTQLTKGLQGKKPATIELIQWLWACHQKNIRVEDLKAFQEDPENAKKRQAIRVTLSTLLKDKDDWANLFPTTREGEDHFE